MSAGRTVAVDRGGVGPGAVDRVVVEADGGSRGNPGPSGYGALVRDARDGRLLAERAEHLGVTTNNVAEYSGLIAGLEAAEALGAREVEVRMDSKLVVEQVSGRWQVKQPHLKPLAARATALLSRFDAVRLRWIPRAENAAADALANSAMDGRPVRRDHGPERDADEDAGPSAAASATAPGSATAGAAATSGWVVRAPTEQATTTILVRHGASVLSPERRFSGRGDVPLSPDGVDQARRVAARLADRGGITAVVSSPLRRARRTAEAVGQALGVEVRVDDDLVEADCGAWEGLTFAEVRERWPAETAAWIASPEVAPPGGESVAAVAARALRARDRLLAHAPGATVAVVSHVTPIKTLLRVALDAAPAMLHRLQLDVTGVSEVDWYADGSANVRLVNGTDHLR